MTKRASDLIIASLLLLITIPIMVVAAIGSAVVLRTWPFFVQQRVGLDGRAFKFLKVRTLPTSTPAYLLKNELTYDGVPWFTRTLRNLHFDELPQLFLVLAGRMSLVGPRPEMVEFHERLDTTFAAERTSIRPGCTGLWQISEASDGLIGDAPEFDRFYLQHHGLRLDLWILGQTARMMLGLGGAHRLDEVPGWAVEDTATVIPLPARPAGTSQLRELELADAE